MRVRVCTSIVSPPSPLPLRLLLLLLLPSPSQALLLPEILAPAFDVGRTFFFFEEITKAAPSSVVHPLAGNLTPYPGLKAASRVSAMNLQTETTHVWIHTDTQTYTNIQEHTHTYIAVINPPPPTHTPSRT